MTAKFQIIRWITILLIAFTAFNAMPETRDAMSAANLEVVDISGERGQDGQDGEDRHSPPPGYGQKGYRGGNAGPAGVGTDAGYATFELGQPVKGQVSIYGQTGPLGNSQLTLRNHSKELTIGAPSGGHIVIQATGGGGGDGGAAGSGGPGSEGRPGTDATRSSNATRGDRGGAGGDSGDPTDGANGGKGGQVTISAPEALTSLFMLVDINVKGGEGGQKGKHGHGGPGGKGGEGGDGITYSVDVQKTVSETDAEGNTTYKTVTEQEWRSRPPASDGPDGPRGNVSTKQVKDGKDGPPGRTIYQVKLPTGEVRKYRGRYDLQVSSYEVYGVDRDGIISPGETIYIRNVTVKNVGPMPTPADSTLFSIASGKWIQAGPETLELKQVLQSHEQTTLDGELSFKVRNTKVDRPGDRWQETDRVIPLALMTRANRYFSKVQGQTPITVTFPIEITPLTHLPSLKPGEATQVLWKVTNISKATYGVSGKLQREVRTWSAFSDGDMNPENMTIAIDKDNSGSQGENAWIQAIDGLQPGESRLVEATVGLSPDTQPYSAGEVRIGLDLRTHDGNTSTIQFRDLTIRAAKGYEYQPGSGLLLITNPTTTKEEVTAYEKLATRLGTSLTTWDLSVEGVIDFMKGLSHTKLADDFRNKTIILANNSFNFTDTPMRGHYLLDRDDVLEAIHFEGIGLYIVNPPAEGAPSSEQLADTLLIPSSSQKKDLAQFSSLSEYKQHLSRVQEGGLTADLARSTIPRGDNAPAYTQIFEAEVDRALGIDTWLDSLQQDGSTVYVNDWIWFGKVGSSRFADKARARLTREAERLQNTLARTLPAHRYVVVIEDNPRQLTPRRFWRFGAKNVNYGSLRILRTLDTGAGGISLSSFPESRVHSSDFVHSPENLFALFAASGLEQKIQFLSHIITVANRDNVVPREAAPLVDSILMDFANYEEAIQRRQLSLSEIREGFRQQLDLLSQLKAHLSEDASAPLASPLETMGGKILTRLFGGLTFIAESQVSFWSYLSLTRRQLRIRDQLREQISEVAQLSFGSDNVPWWRREVFSPPLWAEQLELGRESRIAIGEATLAVQEQFQEYRESRQKSENADGKKPKRREQVLEMFQMKPGIVTDASHGDRPEKRVFSKGHAQELEKTYQLSQEQGAEMTSRIREGRKQLLRGDYDFRAAPRCVTLISKPPK